MHVARAVNLIHSVGALVRFLPAYSPHLIMNPIEELFSKVKSVLKDIMTRQFNGLEMIVRATNIVQTDFSSVSSDDCFGWFQHAGYVN